jgi:uncharacterized membrane protein YqjE
MALLNNRSVAEVLQDIVGNVQEIIRSEFRLAKAETREEVSKAVKSSVMLGTGIVLAAYAVGFLLLTIMYALEISLPQWLSALIVSVAVLIIAMLAVSMGRKRMKQVHVPEKTIGTVKENVQWARHQIR